MMFSVLVLIFQTIDRVIHVKDQTVYVTLEEFNHGIFFKLGKKKVKYHQNLFIKITYG